MQTNHTVAFYVGNRIDRVLRIEPHRVAEQFIDAVRRGYFKEPCGGGGEWAFRLWLTGPEPDGFNATWDVGDEDVLFGALRDAITADDEVRAMLTRAVWGES